MEASEKELNRQFRLHLHRVIAYLASPNAVRSIGDLVRLAEAEGQRGRGAEGQRGRGARGRAG